jgi:ribulose 1,5-bisphosphate carboxylase large subunit-like protein
MSRQRVTTATGREICVECRDRITAAAGGVIANPEGPVGGAIATAGWFRRIKDARRRGRSGGQ